jgi:alpha-ribazole phosphatase CobZ
MEMETKICINDATFKMDNKSLVIQRDDGFLSIGSPTIGSGVKTVKSIINFGAKYDEDSPLNSKEEEKFLEDFINDNNVFKPAAAMMGYYDIKSSVNITIGNVTALVNADYEKNNSMNIIVIIDKKLNERTLLRLFKAVVEAKSAALWDYGVINHFSFDPLDGGMESILVACSGSDEFTAPEEVEDQFNLQKIVEKCVRDATGGALRNCGFPKSVIDFINDVGIEVEDLVEAGMELLVGVERNEEISIKLHNQILKSLEDLNVVSFIIAGIRLEEDYEKHRVKGVNVDDDPAYLYSDEVMGMAVANQIAGTKAIFNFKRYDEAKPGVIGNLGPVLDDIFAGLVSGCMSKIFED